MSSKDAGGNSLPNFYVGEIRSPLSSYHSLSSITQIQMIRISEIDETLMAICAETQGCFEMDVESGEQNETCFYAMLIQLG